ncbi:MAG: aromatic ring-hydroxylating dioxygenase subunit alpha [Myxococcota bacterium]|nr:aromatic ring-hydroxylating dioxygenase subunit alpha [Myxococcota bacterium]
MDERTARALTVRIHALAQEKATELAPASLRVPMSYYRDPSLWDWERRELLRSRPIVAAPGAQIPRPGDYHARELLGTSVLVTRDRKGRAHTLLNYCSHRGARIADGSGSASSFTCPYHAWTYGSDGRLLARPRAACFDDLPQEGLGLVELPSEERHGLIWCVLEPDAVLDLDEHLGLLEPELAHAGYGDCTYLGHRDVEIGVNWKAALENFGEFYHVPTVHTVIAGSHVDDSAGFDAFGPHHRLLSGLSSLYELSAEDAARVDDDGHLVVAYWIFPNLVVAHSRPTIDLVQVQPGSTPDSCLLRHTSLARRPLLTPGERESYARIRETVSAVLTREDAAALERAGDGIAHSARDHVLIGRNEPGVQNIVRTLRAAAQARGA